MIRIPAHRLELKADGTQSVAEDLERRIETPGDHAGYVQRLAQFRMTRPAHQGAPSHRTAGHAPPWCHANKCRECLDTGKLLHIPRISQRLRHDGVADTGNAAEQVGIVLEIGVTIDVAVHVALDVSRFRDSTKIPGTEQ